MNIKELYEGLKQKLQDMYENNKIEVRLDRAEFFAVYKAICDMVSIKHITDGQ